MNAQEAISKAQRAAQLQAQIAASLNATGIANLFSGSSTPSPIASRPKEPNRNVIIDEHGRTIDTSTGEVIELTHHTPTLKANLRAKRVIEKSEPPVPSKKPTTQDIRVSKYFDPRLSIRPLQKARKTFNFIEEGKYVKLAQRSRATAQLERLKNSVAAAAKRTGIESAAKLATIQPKQIIDDSYQPDIEWWDAYLFKTDVASSYSTICDGVSVNDIINSDWITHLVEHPIKMKAPSELEKPPEIPVFLTKKERKKLRRQTRQEVQKDKQEKVRLGLIPPDEPKVRLANLMRALGTDAVQDPTKVEAMVRAQMEKRKRAHEAANAKRKLTKDQTREKKVKKLKEDTSHGVHVAVYRVYDLSNPSHKFKVESNCNQLFMTGYVALNKDCNVVVVEGGPKQQKKFKRLMLNRIRWKEVNKRVIDPLNVDSSKPALKQGQAYCVLVWEGTVKQRAFDKIQFKTCPTEVFAREQFRKHNVEHYWDLSYSGAVIEAAGEDLL